MTPLGWLGHKTSTQTNKPRVVMFSSVYFSDMKVIILGDYSVGKTSLICRYIEGKFHTQEPVSINRLTCQDPYLIFTLRKHAYSNTLRILPSKKWKFSDKKIWYFSWWGSSNECPQSMLWAKIRKLMYTPVNPSFTIWKWGLRGSAFYRYVFVMN